MSQSSKRSHTAHESKSVKFWKSFLAFMLFLSLTATSLCACMRLVILSPNRLINLFCNEQYIAALKDDLTEYAIDVCESSAIPSDGVEEVLSFSTVYQIEKAYIAGMLEADEQYTATTYQDFITRLGETIQENTAATLEKQGIAVDETVTDGPEQLAKRITDYITERVEFPLMDELQATMNLGSIGSMAGAIGFAVLSLVLALIILTFKTKMYRSLREVVYALLAASLTDFCLVAGVALVGVFKDLVLYPAYLADAVMVYIGNCMLSVAAAGGILFFIALILMVVIWKVKRDNSV